MPGEKVYVVGGCGAMASSCTYDLCKNTDFDEIVIVDSNEENARKLINVMGNDPRASYVNVDVSSKSDLVKFLKKAKYIVNGLPFDKQMNFMEALNELQDVICVDINAADPDKVLAMSDDLASKGTSQYYFNGGLVITTLMAVLGCGEMDEVDEVNFYWGMWRPITHTTFGLALTCVYEHDPRIKDRVVWESGKIIDNYPPFALPKEWVFPDPIGLQEVYVIPHPEPVTFPEHPIAKKKNVKRVTCRGLFHHGWIRYVRALLETGIFEAEPIEIAGTKVSPLEVCQKTLIRESKEQWEDPYKIAKLIGWEPQVILSVEIIGLKKGIGHRVVYHCQSPYPFFDGNAVTPSMEYGSYVGVPASITLEMMANNEFEHPKGVFMTESCGLAPGQFIDKLEARNFKISKYYEGASRAEEYIPIGRKDYKCFAWES